ncbi:RidA family protein [candidate division WWE3 bacterium]|jgi:enamine deaminase RidA (YjgF/YER057c/UK114 family)|uniref:RidA family protein n=1 Tax=candidate division WWE3 bacterium TaxID=2053526 RepID=A0A3A4ZKA9_UNCKA|nr:MAG: RidA family protein [candidate division WWE3 bacterium]
MNKKQLCPEFFAHKKRGAYSYGISVDLGNQEMIFLTGLAALDEWGNPVFPGNYSKQTEYIFSRIEDLLAEADATIYDIIRVVIYITDINRFDDVAKIRNKYLWDVKPVSTLVEVSGIVKEGCNVEIEVTAIKDKSDTKLV